MLIYKSINNIVRKEYFLLFRRIVKETVRSFVDSIPRLFFNKFMAIVTYPFLNRTPDLIYII